jgi:hypothetical protein
LSETTKNKKPIGDNMRNEQVIKAFTMERAGKAGNLYTDGKRIYSYGVTIGFNLKGRSYVIDYTSTGGHFLSQTTSTHVNRLKREAGVKTITSAEYKAMFYSLIN